MVEEGKYDKLDNPLKNAPHSMDHVVCNPNWTHPYTREEAAFPRKWVKDIGKIWPAVGRIDSAYGDRNLICTCPSVDSYKID